MSDDFQSIITEWMQYPSNESPQEWMARQIISLRGSLAQQQEQAAHAKTFAELHAKVEAELRQRIAELVEQADAAYAPYREMVMTVCD
jgi:hypothetical protein